MDCPEALGPTYKNCCICLTNPPHFNTDVVTLAGDYTGIVWVEELQLIEVKHVLYGSVEDFTAEEAVVHAPQGDGKAILFEPVKLPFKEFLESSIIGVYGKVGIGNDGASKEVQTKPNTGICQHGINVP